MKITQVDVESHLITEPELLSSRSIFEKAVKLEKLGNCMLGAPERSPIGGWSRKI
jgi:hypothetical protein